MFTISVCMIVKNESEVLARVLTCAKSFADEIIVVDTGSTDNTKEIAKNFTDKVFDFKWCDDFAMARNFSFSFATCDFQMWLDADDFLTAENIEKIKKLKNADEDADVFMCKYSTGFDAENKPALTYFRERILRRACNFRWQGFVHEVIVPSGKIVYTDIEVEHRKVSAGDPKRNLKLYQKALKNGAKFSARELYYYSRELFYGGQYQKCAQNLRKFIKIKDAYPPDLMGAHIMLSDCFEILGEKDKAIEVLLSYLSSHTPNAEICCKLGYLFDKLNKPESAIFWFKSALDCPPQSQGFVREECQEFLPCLELSRLLYQLDYASAKEFHQKAKTLRPKHPSVNYNERFFKK